MSNCSCSANSQLKALHARLDRIDDDLMCHYAGISQLVHNLSLNTLITGNVTPSLTFYNLTGGGQKLLKELIGLVPGYDTFKQLQHLDAAALVEGMAATMANQALTTVQNAVDSAAAAVESQVAAAAALAQAIEQGLVGEALAPFQAAVDAANAAVASANSLVSSATSFMKTLSDIANCKTSSAIIDNT